MSTTEPAAEAGDPHPGRRNPARLRRFVLEGTLALGVILAITAWQTRHLVSAGTRAPAFDLRALDGQHVSLASLRGKRVLVHFWATWCGVCRMELGALSAVHATLSPDEALISIAADADDEPKVRAFVAEHDLPYRVLLGTDEVVRAFRVGAFPTNYYLDGEGNIKSSTVGMSTRLAMRARMALAR
jgi:peroxiredoxin